MRHSKNWFPTFTGVKFYPTDPILDDIRIEDIAHALSQQCRFAGHCNRFYSVAQHSLLVATYASEDIKLEALLHDAAEAYCQDLIRPIKHEPELVGYREICERLDRAIQDRFNLRDFNRIPEIKILDNRALMTERRDLYSPELRDLYDWQVEEKPFDEWILPISPSVARQNFITAFSKYYRG